MRHGAAKDPKAAAQEAARAFESLFMNELMKSMRAATESRAVVTSPPARVVTDRPTAIDIGRTQERTGLPSTWTVQAPHWARPQPKWGLFNPSSSLST